MFVLAFLACLVATAAAAGAKADERWSGDLAGLKVLVAEKRAESAGALRAFVNARGPGKQTPLMAAILRGDEKVVEYLLTVPEVDVTVPEKDGYLPMDGAGFQGRPGIADMLLEHGLSADMRHRDGFAPMHRSCWGRDTRHAQTVDMFLEHGVDVNLVAVDSKTCADMAAPGSPVAGLVRSKGGKTAAELGTRAVAAGLAAARASIARSGGAEL